MKKQKKKNKPKKDTSKKTVEKKKYFHCNTDSHWRRNYPLYLKSLRNNKGNAPFEGMLTIESHLMIFSTSSWVLNSSSSAHICTLIQILIESRRLRQGEMILWIDNEAKVAAETIDTYPL